MQERRQYIRVKARLYLGYKTLNLSKIEGHCWSRDISIAGIGVILKDKLDIGTMMEISLDLRDNLKPLISKTKVYWQVESPRVEAGKGKTYRTGMIFLNLDEEGKKRIENFLTDFLRSNNK